MHFFFRGVSEYLEDLVICIDAPQLYDLNIILFNQTDFDTPQLAQFINRTPKFRACQEARVQFEFSAIILKLTHWIPNSGYVTSQIRISCREPDWQLSSVAQVCRSSLSSLSTVEDLHIEHHPLALVWVENTMWLELLLPFTTVKKLYLAKECAPGIAATLQELVGARITEVLPSLRNIFVMEFEFMPQKPFREHIGKFVAARQLSGHPVAIFAWNTAAAPELIPFEN